MLRLTLSDFNPSPRLYGHYRAERSQGDRTRTAIREAKKKERDAVAGGKKPFYLKGSDKKRLSLEQRCAPRFRGPGQRQALLLRTLCRKSLNSLGIAPPWCFVLLGFAIWQAGTSLPLTPFFFCGGYEIKMLVDATTIRCCFSTERRDALHGGGGGGGRLEAREPLRPCADARSRYYYALQPVVSLSIMTGTRGSRRKGSSPSSWRRRERRTPPRTTAGFPASAKIEGSGETQAQRDRRGMAPWVWFDIVFPCACRCCEPSSVPFRQRMSAMFRVVGVSVL